MTFRASRFSLIAIVILVLSACSDLNGADDGSLATEGVIELAVSETCTEVSPQCLSVNGGNVLLPSAFERASVVGAALAAGEGQNAVDITFSEDGEAVLHALTEKAARAGEAARLVLKIGGEIRAAVRVMQVLEDDHIQIILSSDDSAQKLVDLIHQG
ncbi:MAG: hypothetical protein ACYC2K_17385 [Gemmatimonadales bacterium]